ncbi:acyltransferase family protein [Spongisporangium articulatum]|uniref:Acyltransferase family protein n=1 Tax=Spongisporangium articulatum TaxID=3362603 RepID=A0ABW8AH30_9ACTN
MSTATLARRSAGPEPGPGPGTVQAPAGPGFLPGVQALRAVAALLVVTFHLWPGVVRGGFAGVDVFFVISGFLITGHLARELERTGRVGLVAFYARRMKRLLPAALTVLATCVVGTILIEPISLWNRALQEVLASALYVENWSLAAGSVDYFAADDPPTAAQHYWSLSVEEQFYIAWPLLLLLATGLLARRLPRRGAPVAVAAVIGLVSFTHSVSATGPAQYFDTFTRAWEFAAGGLLALSLGAGRLPRRVAVTVLWAGLAAVLGGGLWLTESMRFPGYLALIPVGGAAAVIAAGTPGGPLSPSAVLRSRLVQFLGNISYALYLWHWPLVVLFGREAGTTAPNGVPRWVLLMGSVVLATASTYLIEAPVRRLTVRTRRGHLFTLTAGFTGMAVLAAACLAGQGHAARVEARASAQAAALQENLPGCYGAPALDPSRPQCAGAGDDTNPVPSPVAAFEDKPKACLQDIGRAALRVCAFGASASAATRTVAVVGDSHSMAWLGALEPAAHRRSWRLVVIQKGSCPLIEAVRRMPAGQAASCRAWNVALHGWFRVNPQVHEVFVSASSMNQFVPAPGRTWQQTAVSGYLAAWRSLPDSVQRIVVLRDVPRPRPDVVTCAERAVRNRQNVNTCGRPEAQAVLGDPEVTAAAEAATRTKESVVGRDVAVINLNRLFCTNGYCSPAVGGVFVYRDGHHMTNTFAGTLAPYLLAAYDRLGDLR